MKYLFNYIILPILAATILILPIIIIDIVKAILVSLWELKFKRNFSSTKEAYRIVKELCKE